MSHTSTAVIQKLQDLGRTIRAHRQSLHISAATTAECAHISRVTLHRIENGEPSVTMGAYLTVLDALGLQIQANSNPAYSDETSNAASALTIPTEIKLADYPQLKQLAWHIRGLDTLTPIEAFGIYDRNWRHLDKENLENKENSLIEALMRAGNAGEL
jgi:transcriptional regulator with XRE-family HTH domain